MLKKDYVIKIIQDKPKLDSNLQYLTDRVLDKLLDYPDDLIIDDKKTISSLMTYLENKARELAKNKKIYYMSPEDAYQAINLFYNLPSSTNNDMVDLSDFI